MPRIDDIVIVIGSETKTFEEGMKRVDKEMSSLRVEMAKATSVVITHANAQVELKKQQNNLAKQIELQKQKVDICRQAYEKAQQQNDMTVASLTKLDKRYESAIKTLARMERELESKGAEQYARSIIGLTNEMTQLTLKTQSLQDENKKYGTTQERLESISNNFNRQLKLQSEILTQTRSELQKAASIYGDNSDEVTKLTKQLHDAEKAHQQLAKEIERTKDATTNAKEAFGQMGQHLEVARAQMVNAGVDMDALERKAQTAALAVVGIGVASAKAFLDFDRESNKLRVLLDESALTFGKAQKAIIDLSDATGVAAGDLANAAYDALSSGVDTANLIDFMGIASKTAVAGITDAATAVDVLTTAINSYGYSTAQAEQISNMLLLTQDKGKVTVGELAQGMGGLVGIASSAKIPLEEVLSAIAALTANGLDGSQAMSSLTQVISNIIKPTAQAQEQARKMGMQFSASALASKGLVGFLDELDKKTHGNIERMGQLFGSTRALNDVLILTGNGAEIFNETLVAMEGSTGQLQYAFEEMTSGPGAEFFMAMNELKNSAILLGDALTPLITAFSKLIAMISNIPTPVLGMIGSIVMIVAGVMKLGETIDGVSKAVKTAAKAGEVFGNMLSGLDPKIMKIVITVTGIIALLTVLLFIVLALKEGADNAANSLGNAMNSAAGSASTAGNIANQHRAYAHGTPYAPGGMALVGEQGPETVYLPRGSQVRTARQTRESGTGDTFNFNVDAKNFPVSNRIMELMSNAQRMRRSGKHRRR